METPVIRVYFDFVDPACYVGSHLLRSRAAPGVTNALEWIGFELAPPPSPLAGWDAPLWGARLAGARSKAESLDLKLDPPPLVPWTRKAHELHLYADDQAHAPSVRATIFDAFFRDGQDIGRVDVLVEIAASCGMDRTETKAVLDVDRYDAAVAASRKIALAAGVTDVPCHSVDGRLVEGFPDPPGLDTLLPHD